MSVSTQTVGDKINTFKKEFKDNGSKIIVYMQLIKKFIFVMLFQHLKEKFIMIHVSY